MTHPAGVRLPGGMNCQAEILWIHDAAASKSSSTSISKAFSTARLLGAELSRNYRKIFGFAPWESHRNRGINGWEVYFPGAGSVCVVGSTAVAAALVDPQRFSQYLGFTVWSRVQEADALSGTASTRYNPSGCLPPAR